MVWAVCTLLAGAACFACVTPGPHHQSHDLVLTVVLCPEERHVAFRL